MAGIDSPARLARTAFHTSRLLDFCSEKELTAQTGHEPEDWPLVVLKELIDNGLDACEEAAIAPEIVVRVDEKAITVTDNGPGLPPEVVGRVLDFSTRTSSRAAYISPSRGQQGNALMTIIALPFVLDGKSGAVEIEACDVRHEITFKVDPIRQEPLIDHRQEAGLVKNGTRITVRWPDSARSILEEAEERFLQIAADYAWSNPHLTLSVDWFGRTSTVEATLPSWPKWRPCDPTSAHWYGAEQLQRLIAAYLGHDEDAGRERTVRQFVGEFRGLTGTAKQKRVLETTGLGRASLSVLRNGNGLDAAMIELLCGAMRANSAPVKPEQLGIIGKEHLQRRFAAAGCKMESFEYRRVTGEKNGLPWIIEAAFGWCPQAFRRRLVTGINWAGCIINPFRTLGWFGESLDGILAQQRAGPGEPVIVFLHLAHPRVQFTDRGKSAIAASTLHIPALTKWLRLLAPSGQSSAKPRSGMPPRRHGEKMR